jgi:hypothetical protein
MRRYFVLSNDLKIVTFLAGTPAKDYKIQFNKRYE